MKNQEEPLTAVMLKGLSILMTLSGLYYIASMMMEPVLQAADLSTLTKAASEHAAKIIMLWVSFGAAIIAWWMGSILTLLDRIAKNGGRQESPSRQEAKVKQQSGRSLSRDLDVDGGVPKYEL